MKISKPTNKGLFLLSLVTFSFGHLITVVFVSALLAGWQDVEYISGILNGILCILIPFILFGKTFTFLGVGIYIISSIIWGILLSLILIVFMNRSDYKQKTK